MKARFVLAGAAALAASSAIAGVSRADVPMLPFDSTCEVERSSKPDRPCQGCEADFLEADACERALRPKGLTRHCRGGGVAQWTEVWCGAAAPSTGAVPPAPPASAPAPPVSAAPSASVAPGRSRSGCTLSPSSVVCAPEAVLAACGLVLVACGRRARAKRRTPTLRGAPPS